ncbi:MAG: hypothetical protein AB1420_14295 [Bacillota bacterium]
MELKEILSRLIRYEEGQIKQYVKFASGAGLPGDVVRLLQEVQREKIYQISRMRQLAKKYCPE